MNPIIKEILKNGIPVIIDGIDENDNPMYSLEGFYKSSGIKLKFDEKGILFAHARYDEVIQIDSLYDIAHLNYKWWMDYKDSFIGWSKPQYEWTELLLKLNLIKVETNTIYTSNV